MIPRNNAPRSWECGPDEQLTGPEPLFAKCHWRGTLYTGKGFPLDFWCETYQTDSDSGQVLQLIGVMIDTSERYDGIVMRKRMTWQPRVLVFGCPVIIFPYEPQSSPRPESTSMRPEDFPS